MTPRFLSLEDILFLHQDQITRYGGASGLRDLGRLESALATPAASFGGRYLHDGPPHMAAAYLFHIAKNHPFLDGNKRTALAAAIGFLGINGWVLDANPDELADVVLAVADGSVSTSALTVFFEDHARPRRRR